MTTANAERENVATGDELAKARERADKAEAELAALQSDVKENGNASDAAKV